MGRASWRRHTLSKEKDFVGKVGMAGEGRMPPSPRPQVREEGGSRAAEFWECSWGDGRVVVVGGLQMGCNLLSGFPVRVRLFNRPQVGRGDSVPRICI